MMERISRREALRLGLEALIVGATSGLFGCQESSPSRRAKQAMANFGKTLQFMDSFENPEVGQAAQRLKVFKNEYDKDDKTNLAFIDCCELEKEFASVTRVLDGEDRLQIVLSLKMFTDRTFSEEEAARALYKALWILDKARSSGVDPKKFSIDQTVRDSLARQAKIATDAVFPPHGKK